MDERGERPGRGDDNDKFILVAVHTTSGSYPEEGHERVNVNQKLRVVIEKATRALNITDTSNWIALLDGDRQLNVDADYDGQGLSGTVDIDWGPQEGGGGRA